MFTLNQCHLRASSMRSSPVPIGQHDCMFIDFMRKFTLALPWHVGVLKKLLLSTKDTNRNRSVCSF